MRLNSGFLRILCFFLLATALAARATAQARLNGTVLDDAGKPIRSATVTAEELANLGQTFSATTDEKGQFTMLGLRPGEWKLVASAPGYLPEAGEVRLRSGNNANPPVTIAIRRSGVTAGALGGVSARELQAQLTAADGLFNEKRWDESVAAYRAILAKTPLLTTIHLQIAAAHRAKGDLDAALVAYRDLLRADPDNERARIGISAVSLAKGDIAAAEAELMRASESARAGRETFFALGDLKFDRGDTSEAIRWYQKAAAADPSWGKPLYKLGLSAKKQGDSAAAADYMTKTIAVDPVSAEATLARAAIAELNK